LVPVLFTIYVQGVLILKKNSGAKGLMNGGERESVVVKVSLLILGPTFASNIRRSNFLTQFYESVLPRARSERTGLLEAGVASSVRTYLSVCSIRLISRKCIYFSIWNSVVGRDSSVVIATRYGLDGPGIESRWGRDFPHLSRPTLGPT
jgi:hypothetical protein